jgi:hypothetical protein
MSFLKKSLNGNINRIIFNQITKIFGLLNHQVMLVEMEFTFKLILN